MWTMLVISGTFFPNAWVNHRNKVNYLPLMLFVIGPPSSGKGPLAILKRVTNKINEYLRNEYNNELKKYKEELRAYKEATANGTIMAEPVRPKLKMVEIPANTTSSKFIEQISDNGPNVISIVVEGEIDVFVSAAKGKHGEMNSSIMRHAFQQEALSLRRKTNDEYINILTPKLAYALSGTFNQLKSMVPSNEDGTYSRFLILNLKGSLTWSDVKPTKGYVTIDSQLDVLAEAYLEIFRTWSGRDVEVRFRNHHYAMINDFGSTNLNDSFYLGEHAPSIVKRHSLMLMRIAGTLTMLRNFDNDTTDSLLYCSDIDFDSAYMLTKNSLEHSLELFQKLPGERLKKNANQQKLLELLPAQFDFNTAKLCASQLSPEPAERTVYRWLDAFINKGDIIKNARAVYEKKGVAGMAVSVIANHQPETFTATDITATHNFSLS